MERNCKPMNKNCIEGAAKQGERAFYREALVIKARWCRCSGCAAKECVLTRGDFALFLKGRRHCRSEKSAEVVVAGAGAAEAALPNADSLSTEVQRLVRQRVGQDRYRQAMLDYWGGACAVTGLTLAPALRAS